MALGVVLAAVGCDCDEPQSPTDTSQPRATTKATASPMATAETKPKAKGGKLAKRLVGRWQGLLDLEFNEDGTYIIHGEGGDVPGSWKALWESTQILTIETKIPAVSTDKIELSFSDADHFTWKNMATWKPGDELTTYERKK